MIVLMYEKIVYRVKQGIESGIILSDGPSEKVRDNQKGLRMNKKTCLREGRKKEKINFSFVTYDEEK
ncbi:hypothetical protein [Halalkalibacter krulwichiae]|uniref:hypothetical protein n=1 Tax=Halalkalibacter krulwichiae TaxID=199441 RepID=UPI000824E9CF|nr:hypothetical protein [Halalkalibacter krulwichiae]